jgi:integrase
VWRGCFSQARRSKPGAVIVRDEKFWLPLIAVYSGMRQEEICQLHCEDIRQHEGVWVFDVHDAPPRQLKNRNARRLVPLHHKLIEVGLLDYVDELRREGSSRIFPNLKPGGADDRFGHNFAKWFTRYRRDVGLYEPLLDFHSLRHSATTFLIQAGVEPILVDALTGHETAGETARYTKQFKIEQLRAAIDQLNPELDLSHLAHEGM